MISTMMDFDLTVGSLLQHASRFHGERDIASRQRNGEIRHYSYADLRRRCSRLCNALAGLGVRPGDRVGTLAGNSSRHLEVYFAVPAMGAIVHTINPRLFPQQVEFIINHAADSILLVEPGYLKLIAQFRDALKTVRQIIVLDGDTGGDATLLAYDDLLDQASEDYAFPAVDERTGASLCYTSGTTGNPKGVLYSNRSIVLHCLMMSGADWYSIRKRDAVLPIVPMYHVNAWSLPYATAMNGAKLVLPDGALDSRSLYELIDREQVTVAAGVPTIWTDMIGHLETEGKRLDSLERVIVGGTAPAPAMIRTLEEVHGVRTIHGWGMTETSSCGLLNTPDNWEGMSAEERGIALGKQGRPPYPVNVKIVMANGEEAPWDGKTFGNLHVAGPTVTDRYFNGDGIQCAKDGWLDTGDIAVIDANGHVQIVDRDKDVIKSGGEWISSITLENVAASHPGIAEAAVIGARHPRWDERPLLIAVARPGKQPDRADLLAHFAGKVAKWWIPDDVVFVESLPRQATGKVSKAQLREDFGEHLAGAG